MTQTLLLISNTLSFLFSFIYFLFSFNLSIFSLKLGIRIDECPATHNPNPHPYTKIPHT